MIKALHIQNFRTQKQIKIELSPTITTIIGESAEGKSTILRAFKYAALNKPAGDGMINWDANKVIVRIFAEDSKVVRIRSKSINKYLFNTKSFVAFGNNIPDEITNFLNLSDINFQGQFERHFWFCETPGEVSRQLNSIINLSIIDRTLFNIASEMRETKDKIKLINERLTIASSNCQSLKYAKKMNKDLCRIEKVQHKLDEIAQKRLTMADLIRRGVNAQKTKKRAANQATGLGIIVKTAGRCLEIGRERQTLENLIFQTAQTAQTVSIPLPSIQPLEDLKIQITPLLSTIKDLKFLMNEIEKQEEYVRKCTQELEQSKKQFNKITKGKCPICGKQMKKS